MMRRCAVCGNEYDKSLRISSKDRTDYYDCFECAIHDLAPKCDVCGLSIIGHGIEIDEIMFCSSHCARVRGKLSEPDRIPGHMDYVGVEL